MNGLAIGMVLSPLLYRSGPCTFSVLLRIWHRQIGRNPPSLYDRSKRLANRLVSLIRKITEGTKKTPDDFCIRSFNHFLYVLGHLVCSVTPLL